MIWPASGGQESLKATGLTHVALENFFCKRIKLLKMSSVVLRDSIMEKLSRKLSSLGREDGVGNDLSPLVTALIRSKLDSTSSLALCHLIPTKTLEGRKYSLINMKKPSL